MKPEETMRLYASLTPGIKPGIWTLEADQQLVKDDTMIYQTADPVTLQIAVELTPYVLPQETIIQRYPLPNTSGAYTNTLPHVILKDPFLPWCGDLSRAKPGMPSLALLVLTTQELQEGGFQDVQQQTIQTYNQEIEALAGKGVFHAPLTYFAKESGTNTCSFLRVKTALLEALLPKEEELPYFAHCRQVNIDHKAELDLHAEGLFSVVLSARLPQAYADHQQEYQAHLVRLDGWYQTPHRTYEYSDLITLDSWSFTITEKAPLSFRRFCEDLKEKEAAQMLFRLPPSVQDVRIQNRLKEGYVPMLYHARTGDEGLCWYRSAFTPIPCIKQSPKKLALTSDAYIIYDAEEGVFDLSLSAAWEAGRTAALADPVYGKALLALRRKGQALGDVLFSQFLTLLQTTNDRDILQDSTKFTQCLDALLAKCTMEDIQDMFSGKAESKRFLNLLDTMDMKKIDAVDFQLLDEEAISLSSHILQETKLRIQQFLKDHTAFITPFMQEELVPLAAWLAKLLLLYPISFDTLIPHACLLPQESIRFFYIDDRWLKAAYAGAISLGLDSSRQTDFNQMIEQLLYLATKEEMRKYRAAIYHIEAPQERKESMSGCFIHSKLVAYWPTLSLQAYAADGSCLSILRMQLLADDILLCILDGIAVRIQVEEPGEGVQMKLLHKEYECFREEGHVLKLEPNSDDGLLEQIARRLKKSRPQIDVITFMKELMTSGERTIFEKEEHHG